MINLDINLRAARMLAAGRVSVTFTSERTGQHITLLAKSRAQVAGKWQGVPLEDAMVVFVEVPNSGWNDRVGRITRSRGFQPEPAADPARVYCANQLIRFLAGEQLPAGLTAVEESCCGRCGRQLTDPVSIERGIGPECYGKVTGSKHEKRTSEPQQQLKLGVR